MCEKWNAAADDEVESAAKHLYNFVPAGASDIAECALDNELRVAEFTHDHRWLVALFSLCQSVALEAEGRGDFLLVERVLLRLNAELELDDWSLECRLGGEAELIALLGEENGRWDLVADLTEEEADACNEWIKLYIAIEMKFFTY